MPHADHPLARFDPQEPWSRLGHGGEASTRSVANVDLKKAVPALAVAAKYAGVTRKSLAAGIVDTGGGQGAAGVGEARGALIVIVAGLESEHVDQPRGAVRVEGTWVPLFTDDSASFMLSTIELGAPE